MDKIIPLRIDESIVSRIDALVSQGLFRNRNEALRQGTRDMIEKYRDDMHEMRVAASKIIANYLVSKYPRLVARVILFGSVARHEDSEWSDVDLLVLSRNPVDYPMERDVIFDIYSLIEAVGLIVSPHFQAEGIFRVRSRVPNSIEAKILEEGIVLAENKASKHGAQKTRAVGE
ncbi:MAG: nucleotidyltransferase domain-containing protein [Candidatus Lokiarchaeota archaeon]|nr:nucleotidyltransferase domain-containing protein [Candidatus Lokiarchaeota archaeon]